MPSKTSTSLETEVGQSKDKLDRMMQDNRQAGDRYSKEWVWSKIRRKKNRGQATAIVSSLNNPNRSKK